MKRGDGYQGSFWLTVDYSPVAWTPVWQPYFYSPQSAVTFNLNLNTGNLVQVQNYGSNYLYGTSQGAMQSFFSGYLITTE